MENVEKIRITKEMECMWCGGEFTLKASIRPEQKEKYYCCPFCERGIILHNENSKIKITVTNCYL